jgi:hypothetical protein
MIFPFVKRYAGAAAGRDLLPLVISRMIKRSQRCAVPAGKEIR